MTQKLKEQWKREFEEEKKKKIFRDYYCDKNSKTAYSKGEIKGWVEIEFLADTFHNYVNDGC